MPASTAPNASTSRQSARERPRSTGRPTAMRNTAAKPSRISATPGTPDCANSRAAMVAPNCTEKPLTRTMATARGSAWVAGAGVTRPTLGAVPRAVKCLSTCGYAPRL